jgi:hypothetical protein
VCAAYESRWLCGGPERAAQRRGTGAGRPRAGRGPWVPRPATRGPPARSEPPGTAAGRASRPRWRRGEPAPGGRPAPGSRERTLHAVRARVARSGARSGTARADRFGKATGRPASVPRRQRGEPAPRGRPLPAVGDGASRPRPRWHGRRPGVELPERICSVELLCARLPCLGGGAVSRRRAGGPSRQSGTDAVRSGPEWRGRRRGGHLPARSRPGQRRGEPPDLGGGAVRRERTAGRRAVRKPLRTRLPYLGGGAASRNRAGGPLPAAGDGRRTVRGSRSRGSPVRRSTGRGCPVRVARGRAR